MGLIGPEVADQRALNIPLDQAEILVTNKEVIGKELVKFRDTSRSPASSRSGNTNAAECHSRPG